MRQNCLEAGMDDCLNKPVTIEQLRKTIEVAARKLGRQTEVKNAPIRQPSGYSTVLDELDEDREEVVRLFLEEIARNLVRLKDAWQKGEPEQVGEIAHALKSGCAYLGAKEAARLCSLVEQNALDGRLPEATLLSQIRTQLERQFPTAWYWLTDTARR
jgi:two-component system sensor histidine kinase EvgS